MKMMNSVFLAVAFTATFGMLVHPEPACAQTAENTFSTQGWWEPPSPPFSPVVHNDNSITFRLRAPDAENVQLLFGEWEVKPQTMTRDSEGVWSITIDPVAPEIYGYVFRVDGVTTLDMVNPEVKAGTEVYSSIVEVPGRETPRFDEVQHVPHGTVSISTYTSQVLRRQRGMYVYLPSQYDINPAERFPVLYVRHGGGDTEASWLHDGRAGVILDNLLARQEAVPMIVVMTNGFTDGTWASGSSPEGLALLEQELLTEIMPLVEQKYRAKTGPDNTAITGLSMGGGQSFVIGLRNLDTFGWIGEFSSGLLASVEFDIDESLPGFLGIKARINQLHALYITCGTDDTRYQGHLDLAKFLDDNGIVYTFHDMPGGHEWKVWRHELHNFMKIIFRSQP